MRRERDHATENRDYSALGGSEQRERFSLPEQYVRTVVSVGGFPVLLPCHEAVDVRSALDFFDGLLLPGGGDVDPIWFGEEPIVGIGSIDPIAERRRLHCVTRSSRRESRSLAYAKVAR